MLLSSGMKKILADVERDLIACNTSMIGCDIIQPAEPFLNMAGEDLRRRIFLTQNVEGEELCLRPEFTIPVCLSHIASHQNTPKRYGYLGQVFRQRKEGVTEFYQAGIEDFGDRNIAQADALAIGNAIELVNNSAQGTNLEVTIGDQAIFANVLSALGLPEGWQDRLIHAFGDMQSLDIMLQTLGSAEPQTDFDPAIKPLIENDDHAALTSHLANVMQTTGYSANASRSPEDIAKRMLMKQRLSEVSLSEKDLVTLREFLDIRVPLADAVSTLENFANKSGFEISQSLEVFAQRIAELQDSDIDLANIKYVAAFGRPLDYYTGLVFEVSCKDTNDVLAAGGRYDRLMELLGADSATPAVGFSLWLDRFEVSS